MFKSAKHRWNRLTALTGRELSWLANAWVALPVVRLLVGVFGVRRTQRVLKPGRTVSCSLSDAEVRKLAWLVKAAATNHFLTLNCLPQSLWLHRCLLRYGVPCQLQYGVTALENGVLKAHAWVEAAGERLNELVGDQATEFSPVPAPLQSALQK